MELEKAIMGRHAVRDYSAEPVDERVIRTLIDAAIHAPSAVNQQPWTFTIVRDQDALDRVSRDAKVHMLAELTARGETGHFHGDLGDPEFHIFYHAPVLILISGIVEGPFIAEDCALAAENMMLTAVSLGLGSCWIGFSQSYLNTPQGKAALSLPPQWAPIAPIIIGYPKSKPAAVAHKEPIIRWIG